jgi:hypothetical protein
VAGEDGSGRAAEHPAAKDEHDHSRQHGAGGPASRTSGASQHTETHRRCAGEGEPPASPAPANRAPALLASNPSLKRVAWAYGCAKKGSDEERMLLAALLGHPDVLAIHGEDSRR